MNSNDFVKHYLNSLYGNIAQRALGSAKHIPPGTENKLPMHNLVPAKVRS